jgi:hypothetical protein
MIENKELSAIARYMESLGIIEERHVDALKMDERLAGFDGAICITHKQHGRQIIAYKFNIVRNYENGLYSVRDYQARMLKIPEITHGIYGGIDTMGLEKRLEKADWHIKSLPMPWDERALSDTFYDLMQLARLDDKAAINIAETLMLKYWAHTPMENMIDMGPNRHRYEKELCFPINMEINDVDDLQAFNLLSGRSVLKFKNQDGKDTTSYWLKEKEGMLITLPEFDLSGILRKLPLRAQLNEVTGPELVLELMMGKRVSLPMVVDERIQLFFIEADPENGTLAIYDESKQKLDLPELKPEKKSTRRINQQIKSARRRPGKGRGL